MNTTIKNLQEKEMQSYEIELLGNGKALEDFLTIHPPEEAKKNPPILAFTRKREIQIPWEKIVNTNINAGTEPIGLMRKYFEQSWDIDINELITTNKLLDIAANSPVWYIRKLSNLKPVYRTKFINKDKTDKETIISGYIIQHSSSGRVYLLKNESRVPLDENDFISYLNYENAWEQKIDGVELVYLLPTDIGFYMDFEEVDMQGALIRNKFEELSIQEDFAEEVLTSTKENLKPAIASITSAFNSEEIEKMSQQVLKMEIMKSRATHSVNQLASDAERLGYILQLKDEGNKKKGDVFKRFARISRWTPCTWKWLMVNHLFFNHPFRFFRLNTLDFEIEELKKVNIDTDPLADKCAELIKEDFQVYVFEQSPVGLISAEGVPLSQIMFRCKIDEDFRRRCAVLLPVYKENMTGQRMIIKYCVYKRPLPGILPTILPRLSLEESLSYRMAWKETQLGELLNSINLAPEEKRKITITRTFEHETVVTQTTTSIFDIQRAESSDLATEMEHQTRREQESSKSLQFSTKASGKFGGYSAEASASGGVNSSLKEMSQDISKVASKAARSLNSQNRQEISTSSSSRTKISNVEETVANIRNINQGRSLNLMFYRLYNKYKGGLFLEGLRFNVISSVELIENSGVHEMKSFSLSELPDLMKEFINYHLPFSIKEDIDTLLINSIYSLIFLEYKKHNDKQFTDNDRLKPELLSVQKLNFSTPVEVKAEKQFTKYMNKKSDSKITSEMPTINLVDLTEALKSIELETDTPIDEQELLIAAQGVYLDAVVGSQPTTEPYSEFMRYQTYKHKKAEVELTISEAHYHEALAQHLLPNGGNWILNFTSDQACKILTLSLKYPLSEGKWNFMLNGVKQAEVQASQIGNCLLYLNWNSSQKWMEKKELVKQNIELFESGKGVSIRKL